MANLPAAGYLSNAARTEGEMKTAFEDQRNFIAQTPGGQAESTLTISVGSVTPTLGVHAIDTEAAAATDDLTNIVQTNLPDGSLLLIHSANAARDTTVKHSAGGAGQIALRNAVDLVLDDPKHYLLLRRNGTIWDEIAYFTKSLDRMPVITKTGAYIVVADDNGKLIDCTSGTFSLTLTAAATLGDGFLFGVKVGSGTITIDPNAAELIDGAATLVLDPGDLAIIVCTGSAWRVISRFITKIYTKGADIASATALNLGEDGDYFHVTGTTTITSIESRPAGFKITLEFDGILTLTYNATTLILQNATNLTTAAGDVITLISEGSGNWREQSRRLATAAGATTYSQSADVTTSESTTSVTYTDLATPGPAVTMSPGSTATHVITIGADMYVSIVGDSPRASVSIAGAGALDVDAIRIVQPVANYFFATSRSTRAASQANGSVHTMKYNTSAGTSTFANRRIIGIVA